MKRQFGWALVLVLALTGCTTSAPAITATDGKPVARALPSAQQLAVFASVVARVEPLAGKMCRSIGKTRRCNFSIVIDDRVGQPRNAYQTQDANRRPLLVFTTALIKDARNADELAFVMGHEMAHHIADHIPQASSAALSGALFAGVQASGQGLDKAAIERAQNEAAGRAVLGYSKEFELQADALGAEIAIRAGYDPVRGSAYFDRLPNPGNRYLSTHPGNAQRKAVVRKVAERLRAG